MVFKLEKLDEAGLLNLIRGQIIVYTYGDKQDRYLVVNEIIHTEKLFGQELRYSPSIRGCAVSRTTALREEPFVESKLNSFYGFSFEELLKTHNARLLVNVK